MMFRNGLGSGCGYGYFNNYGNHFYSGYGIAHSGLWILSVIGIILLVTLFIVLLSRKNNKKHVKNTPDPIIENLKMKYVRGEISEEEYLKRKDFLSRDLVK